MRLIDNLRAVGFGGHGLGARRRSLTRVASVEDLRRLAKRRVPPGVFDYVDGAAEGEITARRNVSSFGKLQFSPRVLNDVSNIDTHVPLLGRAIRFPLVLAPTGFTRILDPQGELAVAREAALAGIPYTLSSLSTRSIEEVRRVSDGRLWFQVYVWKDKGLLGELLERASASAYEAIVITVDTAVLGSRERDVRRGFTLPPKLGLRTLLEGARYPAWALDFMRAEPIRFANLSGGSAPDGASAVSLAEYITTQFDPSLSWGDIDWFRQRWNGPIVLKGIQSAEDAITAAGIGVDAIAISNHGGRQLDDAPPSIELVRPVREAVQERLEIICDGGVRRGSDIVKALALGATACMAGRFYLYGLGAAGQAGVGKSIRLMENGVRRTLALLGCQSVDQLSPEIVNWRS